MSEVQKSPTPPTWLNESFMEDALRSGFKDDQLKIVKCEVSAATSVGDNYGSQMFRFNLDIKSSEEKKLSVVVKILLEGGFADQIDATSIFENEVEAYSKSLPAVHKYIEKAYPNHERLWADCYFYKGAPYYVIVLEDLKKDGFTLANRSTGLDEDHTRLLLKSLAKYHACSLLIRDEIKSNERPMFWSRHNVNKVKPILTLPFNGLVRDFKNWPEFKRKSIIYEKLKSMEVVMLEKVFKAWEKDESKLNVLIHGDSWINNFMFRYDADQKVNGIKLVDFQLTGWSTPAMDLQNIIFTSVNPDIMIDRIDEFLETYYETFQETLKRLGHQPRVPFGLNDLKENFEEKYIWGFVVFFSFFPAVNTPKKESFVTDSFLKNDGSDFEQFYQRDAMREYLKRGFAFFEEKGIL